MGARSLHVVTEVLSGDVKLRSPYRGTVTGRTTLRLRVTIAPRGSEPREVVIDVDDLAIEVRWDGGYRAIDAGAVDALFVVESQPRFGGFLTWFAVFARHRGAADRLLLATPEAGVARLVERTIEDRLGLGHAPVRGELRAV
ncbi:MAG TPA: hypothetical protein VGM88_16160 [Kofleriaceae bacterium]|jgi:hypothetical protein